MHVTPKRAANRVVSIWMNRPPAERQMRHTEPFITELERAEPALLGQLRSVNHYQAVMGLIRRLTSD